MENSLDSGARNIHISVINGGLESIKVKDDGSGIQVEDMSLLCKRHTTSKLKTFSDLHDLSTFGFRGEALASISNISDVHVVTKTDDAIHGYKVSYVDGIPLTLPKACASNNGTVITICSLFKNLSKRKKSFNPEQEYKTIEKYIQHYGVHYHKHCFSLKKESFCKLRYPSVEDQMSRIKTTYGEDISKDLKHLQFSHSKYSCSVFFSGIESAVSIKKKAAIFFLFVNNRLVESNRMKKQLCQVYKNKNASLNPLFLYLSLSVPPHHVDVNIHPSKKEVFLLNEDDIIHSICQLIYDSVHSSPSQSDFNNPKINYYYKSLSKNPTKSESNTDVGGLQTVPENTKSHLPIENTGSTLVEFYMGKNATKTTIGNPASKKPFENEKYLKENMSKNAVPNTKESIEKEAISLESIQIIQNDIMNAENKDLTKLLRSSKLISYIDSALALICNNNLYYLVNPSVLSEELFYQITITSFSQFGLLFLSPSISLADCLQLFTQNTEELNRLVKTLVDQKELLESYFKILIRPNGQIETLPMLAKKYTLSFEKIPILMYNLATQINWGKEIDCLEGVSREISMFYCVSNRTQWEQVAELLHQKNFRAPSYIVHSGYLIELDIPSHFLYHK